MFGLHEGWLHELILAKFWVEEIFTLDNMPGLARWRELILAKFWVEEIFTLARISSLALADPGGGGLNKQPPRFARLGFFVRLPRWN
jgi:hypothetical protein